MMGRAVVIVLIGLAGAASQAQAPQRRDATSQPVVEPTGSAKLGGVVHDTNNAPVSRATVTIVGDMRLSRSLVTDDAGRFLFADLPRGRFTVTAEKGAYPSMSYGATRPNRPGAGILLAEGQAVTDLALTLARGAVVTGVVYDEHGTPMPDTAVEAWLVRTSLTGERSLLSGSSVVTSDDRGMYRIFGLPPGEYTIGTAWYFGGQAIRVPTDAEIREAFLAASRPPTAPTSAPAAPTVPPRFGYAPSYLEGTVDPLAATTFTLGPGDVRENVDLHVQFAPMSRIEGAILGPDGAAVSGANVVLFRHNKVGPRPTTFFGAGPTGLFTTASLAPGQYSVMALTNSQPASSNAADGFRLWALADVVISGAEPAQVTLRLQPTMTMSGRLVFPADATPAPDPTKVRLNLLAVEGTNATPNNTSTRIEPTGSFVMSGVTPGRFILMATVIGAPGWAATSVTIDGHDVMDRPLDIGTADPPDVVVTFSNQATDLSGVVSAPAGQLASDYFVVALPTDEVYWTPLSRRIKSTRPGADGRYDFAGLPPGQYAVAATTDLTGSDLQDHGVLAELAAHAITVVLGAAEKKTVDLKLGGGLPMTGFARRK
jgi:protocatechuate 3,4-dioxygenase beta subunit